MSSDPFDIIGAERTGRCVVICDHASNRVPPTTNGGGLGLDHTEMSRHIAYDIGAAEVSKRLALHFDGPAILAGFSRLVIDPNRGEDDPTLVRRIYDGTIIPGNGNLEDTEVTRRLKSYYRPYHNAVAGLLASRESPFILSVHSFTSQLNSGSVRPWQMGILSSQDRRISDPLLAALREGGKLNIGDNEPYAGAFAGDTMQRHAIPAKIPHVVLEFRNDLIENEAGQKTWAATAASSIEKALSTAEI